MALLLQPKQSRERLIMSHRWNKIILSSVYSGTVPVWSMMHVESVADHSRWKVWRWQNCLLYSVIKLLQISMYLIRVSSDRCPGLHVARLFAE